MPPTESEALEGPGYRPKPPIWQGGSQKPLSAAKVAIGIVLAMILTAGVLAVGLEGYLWSMPAGQVEVAVVRVEAGVPQDEGPAFYRHLVALPDGSQRRFTSDRLHRTGERLMVTSSRGRLTGRTRLGGPYWVVPSPEESR